VAEETTRQVLPTATGFAAREAIAALRKHHVEIAALLRRAAKAPPWSRRCLRRRLLRQRQTGGQGEAGLPRGFERAPGQASPWRKRLGLVLRCCCSSRDGTGRAPARVLEHGAAELLARLTQAGSLRWPWRSSYAPRDGQRGCCPSRGRRAAGRSGASIPPSQVNDTTPC
jgi:hypothetical protein